LGATCIDQLEGHVCSCPFNYTGSNCDKPIDVDYDLHFFDSLLPSQAALSLPVPLEISSLTLSLWLKFEQPHSRGTVFTMYHSQ
jgi:hypothetical protein